MMTSVSVPQTRSTSRRVTVKVCIKSGLTMKYATHYTVVQILVINIGICFASSYNVFRADVLKLL